MSGKKKKKALGRGVGALLPEDLSLEEEERFFLCDVDKIDANPNQPRSYFDEEKLEQLERCFWHVTKRDANQHLSQVYFLEADY